MKRQYIKNICFTIGILLIVFSGIADVESDLRIVWAVFVAGLIFMYIGNKIPKNNREYF